MICFAHRGASGHAPENTLAAMEKALSLGTDWVELDVYAVGNELVVIHDDRLERTTNGSGYVLEQSLQYLRYLDAGNGEKIPFLHEVFDAPVVSLVNRYVKNHGWDYSQILLSSFNHHELHEAKILEPRIFTGALILSLPLDYARFAEELHAYSVHPGIEFLNQAFVDDAHQRGLKVFAYTVNNREELARMQSLGVDGVFTDYPEIMKRET